MPGRSPASRAPDIPHCYFAIVEVTVRDVPLQLPIVVGRKLRAGEVELAAVGAEIFTHYGGVVSDARAARAETDGEIVDGYVRDWPAGAAVPNGISWRAGGGRATRRRGGRAGACP